MPASLVLAKAELPTFVTLVGIMSVPSRSVSPKAHAPISTSEVAWERSRPASLVLAKASSPIVVTVVGIASVPSRLVAEKTALSPIDTSEVASDRSRPVSLVLAKAEAPMVLTAAPTLIPWPYMTFRC